MNAHVVGPTEPTFWSKNQTATCCNITGVGSCLVKTTALITAYGRGGVRRDRWSRFQPSTLRKQPIQAASSATRGRSSMTVERWWRRQRRRGETRRDDEAKREAALTACGRLDRDVWRWWWWSSGVQRRGPRLSLYNRPSCVLPAHHHRHHRHHHHQHTVVHTYCHIAVIRIRSQQRRRGSSGQRGRQALPASPTRLSIAISRSIMLSNRNILSRYSRFQRRKSHRKHVADCRLAPAAQAETRTMPEYDTGLSGLSID